MREPSLRTRLACRRCAAARRGVIWRGRIAAIGGFADWGDSRNGVESGTAASRPKSHQSRRFASLLNNNWPCLSDPRTANGPDATVARGEMPPDDAHSRDRWPSESTVGPQGFVASQRHFRDRSPNLDRPTARTHQDREKPARRPRQRTRIVRQQTTVEQPPVRAGRSVCAKHRS